MKISTLSTFKKKNRFHRNYTVYAKIRYMKFYKSNKNSICGNYQRTYGTYADPTLLIHIFIEHPGLTLFFVLEPG